MARQRQKKLKGFLIRFGIYHVRTDPVTRKQMSTKCTDSEAALSWLANRQRMAQQPAVVASHFATVGDWIDKFLAQKKVGDVRPETVDFWRSKCKPVLRLLGREMPLSDITPGTIDDYIARRRSEIVRGKPVRGYTAKREILALIAALRLAKRADKYEGDLEKLLPENLEASYKPRERALTEREVSQLIHAMPNYTWGALVAVCVGLGCRKSEAFRLRPEDVEVRTTTAKDAHGSDVSVERMFVWIDGRKTEGSNRIVPVLSGMRPLIEYALPHLPVGELGNVARTFSLACQRAQIERCSPNDLRRTHATLIGKRGVKNEFIAGLLGHSSTAMAERVYNQAKADELAPVVEELLSRAAPLEFGALGGDALKSKATPGRKRGGGGTGGGSVDMGDLGGPFDGSDLDGDGRSEASSAVGRSCTADATFSRQCSGTMSFRGAPRKIRTCDLWLRRPGHPSGETAAASNPADANATDGNLTHVNATTCNDVSATLCPDGTADADHCFELGSTGFSSPFWSSGAKGRSPDLTVQRASRLVRTRANGLREYSTPEGSVWGWS
jgi:integrase